MVLYYFILSVAILAQGYFGSDLPPPLSFHWGTTRRLTSLGRWWLGVLVGTHWGFKTFVCIDPALIPPHSQQCTPKARRLISTLMTLISQAKAKVATLGKANRKAKEKVHKDLISTHHSISSHSSKCRNSNRYSSRHRGRRVTHVLIA